MKTPLSGAGVIITRPAGQCEALAEMVEQAGGRPLILPSMSIQPAPAASRWPEALQPISRYQFIIFISQNAVRLGAHYLVHSTAELAAVGPSTARSLEALGHPVSISPSEGFTSEALLKHPSLQNLKDQQVLIVRGVGGRELLAQGLQARGAKVDYLEVYCRSQAQISRDHLDQVRELLAAGKVRFVTATSVQTLENTLQLLGPEAIRLLQSAQLVSASDRVVEMAGELGIATAEPAPGPSDQDLLQHMLQLSAKQASENQ